MTRDNSSDQCFYMALYIAFRHISYNLVHDLSTFDKKQRGDGTYAELSCDHRRIVNIDFGYRDFSFVLFRKFLKFGCDHLRVRTRVPRNRQAPEGDLTALAAESSGRLFQ